MYAGNVHAEKQYFQSWLVKKANEVDLEFGMDTNYDLMQRWQELLVIVMCLNRGVHGVMLMKCWTVGLNLAKMLEKQVRIGLKSGVEIPILPSENGSMVNRTPLVDVLFLAFQHWLHPWDTCGALNGVFS